LESVGCVMSFSVMPGVIVERVGEDLMVIVPGTSDLVSLSGRPAQVLLDVTAGKRIDSADPALRDLVDLGIVSAPGVSRRGLIQAGVIGAGAGIAVLAIPGLAAASSVQRTQLVGAFTRAPSYNYFYIADYNSWVLEEQSVIDYLVENGVTTNLAVLPDPLPSEDLGTISELDVPGFNLTAAPGSNNTSTFIEWLAPADVDFTTFEFAVVGYFSWAGQEFEVFFFNPE
jgi:hypothetical protein